MNKKQQLTLWLELLWWALTALIVWAVLYPINKSMHVWPFQTTNIAFVVIVVTLTRYTFLLKHTFLAWQQEIKVVLILLMFPLTFMTIDALNGFMVYIEENTWEELTGHLVAADQLAIEEYMWREMLLFGVGSVLAPPMFAVRLFMSVWRTRNRGTV